MADADVRKFTEALNAWLTAVEAVSPWRGRILRRLSRSPFGMRCLLTALLKGR